MKQRLIMFGYEKNATIKGDVEKLLKAGHVEKVQFSEWLSNMVLVSKGSGKWRMCIDFHDLNKVCPKDHYPLPRINQLIGSMSGFELLSMMDAYQGYHQIRIFPGYVLKNNFVSTYGTFRYVRISLI